MARRKLTQYEWLIRLFAQYADGGLPIDECVECPFSKTGGGGYAAAWIGEKMVYVHRWVLARKLGFASVEEISHITAVRHSASCVSKACANPHHITGTDRGGIVYGKSVVSATSG